MHSKLLIGRLLSISIASASGVMAPGCRPVVRDASVDTSNSVLTARSGSR